VTPWPAASTTIYATWPAAPAGPHQARTAEPGFRLAFGGPEFDAAVHAVVDRLAGHPAFQTHDEPPIRTGPIVVTLYAGGGPRPEPGPLSDPANVRTGPV
jgi:hypothetical protein